MQAQQSETEARRLRLLAVARELAVKTSQLNRESQGALASLLAVQAYRLHARSGGDPGDPDLFEALRTGLARVAPAQAAALTVHTDAVRSLAVAPGRDVVASGGDDGVIRLLDLAAHPPASAPLAAAGSEVRALAWLDERRLAAGSLDGFVRVFERGRTGPAAILGPVPGGVAALAVRADGALAAAGLDGSVRLWASLDATPRTLATRAPAERIGALAFLDDGGLAAASAGGVLLWNAARPQEEPRFLAAGRRIRAVASGGPGRLAAGTEEGPILLWTAGLDRSPVELSGHSSAVTSLAFSPGGARLASSSLDGSVRLWDAARPDRKPIRLAGHTGWVWAVAFTRAGDELVSGGADRSLRIWPTRAEPIAEAICARKTRNLSPEEWAAYLPADIAWEATCP